MATQIVPQVVPFPSIPQVEQITQVEIALFLSLRGRLQQLEEQVKAAEENIKTRLEAGAIVQPGDHVARLDERSRRNVAWRAISEDLADTVFGEGKGAATWMNRRLSEVTRACNRSKESNA